MKKLLTFLIFVSIPINLVNGGWLLWKERVDLPRETQELIVGTIKNELSLNAKCAKESCRKEVRNLENVLDEISYANQLGRLDTISLILALFGLVIGFVAVAGFLHIKESSERIAEAESAKWLKENAKPIIEDWLTKNLPALLEKTATQKNAQVSEDKSLEDDSLEKMIIHLDEQI